MRVRSVSLTTVLLLTAAASAQPSDQRVLSRSLLLGNAEFAAPTAMLEYTVTHTATEPRHTFSGSLRLQGAGQEGGFEVLHDPLGLVAKIGDAIRHMPEFDFQFAQRAGDIVPLRRGVIRRQHPYWEIVLQPGQAWSEPSDGDWSRASVPFALQERGANCTHNGVLMWLFNDAGDVSRVAYQISSETCGYFKFDMWGLVSAKYEQQDLQTLASEHLARFDVHRERRLPVRPLAQLAQVYPSIDPLSFGIDDGINPEDITVMGMVVDGVHYQSNCATREGLFPYCTSLPLPSYSTAKSIFAGVATMRLEELFPGVAQTLVKSLVEECASTKWSDVTIENALDMATGNYLSPAFNEDEHSTPHIQFLDSDKHADKLEFACNFFKRQAEPGSQFVYHTSDTYLVGAALANFVANHEKHTDLYESVLVQPIWRRLQLSPLLDVSKRTYDRANHAYVGYGLTYEADDIIRIAIWLNEERGRLMGEPILNEVMLDAALQRTPGDRGLKADSANVVYNNGFWAFDAGPSMGCDGPVWVPFMSGYGGITVAMFPNGVIYYYFSDTHRFSWQSARRAANAIGNMCHAK